MIHAATLLHDDVVDGAKSRRGRATASAKWGNAPAVITGNLLLARAFGILVRRGWVNRLKFVSESMLTMCRGEILQNLHRGDFEMTEATYYAVIRAKTADFLAACCRAGAILADADPSTEKRMTDYGMNLGLAFQVTDDLLDLCGEEEEIGKPLGGDLREGKMTLPLILGLQEAAPEERERVKAIARQETISLAALEEVREILRQRNAPERTRRVSERFTLESLAQLEGLAPGPAHSVLESLAMGLSTRSK
jgi:octaprenyl-diphosphate synthase